MQPVEPTQPPEPANPLEITSRPDARAPTTSEPSTELTVPDTPAAPQPVTVPEPATPSGSGPLGNLVVAHLRRVEIAMLGRVLITTLGGALPASMVRVERRRSLWQRLARRPGQAIGVTVTAREKALSFRAPEVGVYEASTGHAVRGVVLSTSAVPLSQWLDELGELLDQAARDDEQTRTALERAVLNSG